MGTAASDPNWGQLRLSGGLVSVSRRAGPNFRQFSKTYASQTLPTAGDLHFPLTFSILDHDRTITKQFSTALNSGCCCGSCINLFVSRSCVVKSIENYKPITAVPLCASIVPHVVWYGINSKLTSPLLSHVPRAFHPSFCIQVAR